MSPKTPAKPERPLADVPPVTYEILCELPDDGKRYEIYDGDLEMTPSPTPHHQDVAANLYTILRRHVEARGLGKVYMAPLDVVFDQQNVAQPDVLFIARERLSIVGETHIAGAPDLAIEVSSLRSARDRVTKRRQYQKFGVKHYWIVDPIERTLEENVLEGGSYRIGALLKGEETFRPAVFPDLEVALAEVFA